MAIDFPNSPSPGANHTVDGKTWTFTDGKWALNVGIGGVQGPTGVTGATGPTGLTGATGITFTGYDHEIHVSQVDGNDTTGNGDIVTPVASITKALTLITGERKTVIVHPGTYTESPSITTQYTVLTSPGLIGGSVLISGTLTASTGCTISGLKITNLNLTAPTATGNLNVLNCDISGTLTKSGSGDYTLIRFCDTGTTNITGGSLTAIFGGTVRFITVSSALARVIIKNVVTPRPVVTAGAVNFVDSIIAAIAVQWVSGTTYAVGAYVYNSGFTYIRIVAGAGSTAPASDATNWSVQSAFNGVDTRISITASANTIVVLANSQMITPAFDNVSRISLSGFYSIFNCVYDKPNSTLASLSVSGGPADSIDYFQHINADKFITQGGTSTQFVKGDGSLDSISPAPLASPALTGTPTAPTAAAGTNTTQIATTEFVQVANPTGAVVAFAGSSAPTNWLLCYGQAVSRATYAALFAVVSTTYGAGDGTTTFNLPDLRGRTVAGIDNMGGSDAGRLDIANSSGTVVGTQYVTLTSAEMPSHTHIQDSHNHTQNSHNHTQDSHGHNFNDPGFIPGVTNIGVGGGGTGFYGRTATQGIFIGDATATNQANTATNQANTATNQNTGGGGAHNNMQPTMVLNYIIKA
jgi:microcystin-dependent protein